MNRRERRRMSALAAKMKPLPPARLDGRPLYNDVRPGERAACFVCEKRGLTALYGVGEVFMCDPANSPTGQRETVSVCKHHIPDNAVIYNPWTNKCRNKAGDHEWMEDAPDPNASFET